MYQCKLHKYIVKLTVFCFIINLTAMYTKNISGKTIQQMLLMIDVLVTAKWQSEMLLEHIIYNFCDVIS